MAHFPESSKVFSNPTQYHFPQYFSLETCSPSYINNSYSPNCSALTLSSQSFSIHTLIPQGVQKKYPFPLQDPTSSFPLQVREQMKGPWDFRQKVTVSLKCSLFRWKQCILQFQFQKFCFQSQNCQSGMQLVEMSWSRCLVFQMKSYRLGLPPLTLGQEEAVLALRAVLLQIAQAQQPMMMAPMVPRIPYVTLFLRCWQTDRHPTKSSGLPTKLMWHCCQHEKLDPYLLVTIMG